MDRARPAAHIRSLFFDHEIGIEEISLLVGHNGTDTTERVYRRRSRPVRRFAATAVNRIPHDVGWHPHLKRKEGPIG